MEYIPGDVIDNCLVATWTHNDLVIEAYQHVSAEVNVNYGSKGHAGLLTCYSNAQSNQPGAVKSKSRISRVFLPETTKTNTGYSISNAYFTKHTFQGLFGYYWLFLIPAWINHHVHHNAWDEITCPLPNFNGYTV